MNKNVKERISKLSPFSKFVWYLCYYIKAIGIYETDNYFGFEFNWWHPLTWIILIFILMPTAYLGIHVKHVFPIKMNEYWVKRNEGLVWL